MDAEITINAGASVILAEGKRRSPFGLGFWIALGVCTLLLAGLFGFYLALSREVKIPAAPSLILSIVPAKFSATRLLAYSPAGLPFENDSNWPMALGFYRENETWQWFAVMPIWVPHGDARVLQKAGLIKVIGSIGAKTRPFAYTDQYAWHGWLTKPLAFRLDSRLLADLAGLTTLPLEKEGVGGGSIVEGRLEEKLIVTNQPALLTSPPYEWGDTKGVLDADISLHISALQNDEMPFVSFTRLLDEQHVGLALPPTKQWSLWLDSEGKIAQTLTIFEEKLNASQIGALLGNHGFSIRRAVKLPDGTMGFERVAPSATNTADLLGTHTDSQGNMVELTEESLKMAKTDKSHVIGNADPDCGQDFEPQALFTGRALKSTLLALKIPVDISEFTHFYLGSTKKRLALCINP